jgi:hypothetical protein
MAWHLQITHGVKRDPSSWIGVLGRRRVPVPGTDLLVCAACGSRDDLCVDKTLGGIYFCCTCWERSEPPEADDEVGGSG